ncbi:unnamed protein product [Ixodes hexagonus]
MELEDDQPSCSGGTGPSDSQQDEESARRELRHAYRDLINQSLVRGDEEGAVALTGTLDKAGVLFPNVTRTQEAVLDSKLMVLVALKGRKCATKLPVGLLTFDAKEFADKVRTVMGVAPGVGQLNLGAWVRFGRFAGGALQVSTPFWYLHGAAESAPPKVRARRAAPTLDKTSVAATTTVPRKVTAATRHETTTEDVGRIHESLTTLYYRLGRPLPYHEFVIHPRSFSKTCENIFHLSFLVNGGHARVALDDNDLLCVEPVDRGSNSGTPLEHGFVMTFSMQQWKDAVQALKLTQPAIRD